MNNHEINEALIRLTGLAYDIEAAYIESGGEVTAETETMEEDLAALKELLTTEGSDSLGRWLKAKQDEIQAAKAELVAARLRVQSLQKTEEYIKQQISRLLIATGTEKVKGQYYSFAQATSTKSAIRAEVLDDAFLDMVTEAARDAGLPGCIDVALKTTTTRLKDAGEEFAPFLEITTEPSVKFTKPRNVKEEED